MAAAPIYVAAALEKYQNIWIEVFAKLRSSVDFLGFPRRGKANKKLLGSKNLFSKSFSERPYYYTEVISDFWFGGSKTRLPSPEGGSQTKSCSDQKTYLAKVVRSGHIRGGQKSKKLETELADTIFPLHLMSGLTKKNFSSLPSIFHPPLAPYIIQRIFQKIQRKISKVSILIFCAIKPIHKLFNGICLHSSCPNASFDTYVYVLN